MNLNQTFSVLFWLNKAKTTSTGFTPIYARITIDGRRTELSVQRQVLERDWDAGLSRAKKDCADAKEINGHLIMVEAEITRHYNLLLTTTEYVSAEDVKRSFSGVKDECKGLLEVFDTFLDTLKERVENEDLSEGRYKRFKVLRKKVGAFIKTRLKKIDIPIDSLKLAMISEFQMYLRGAMSHNTAMKYAKDLKQVLDFAVTQEYIVVNKFDAFKCSFKKVNRQFLDEQELRKVWKKKIAIARLMEVRDCYVFCCYTGYSYQDAADLKQDDVQLGIDRTKWIFRDRGKTGKTENVPLLPIALEIIERYKKHPYCITANRLLPMNSNQRYNAYLKEVASVCGIDKELTSHTARHTFATTVTLSNDVPIETVSELLGHSDIRTTQIYAKIIQKKVSRDIQKLRSKMS
jgi:integrase